jgi:hypothetical protein
MSDSNFGGIQAREAVVSLTSAGQLPSGGCGLSAAGLKGLRREWCLGSQSLQRIRQGLVVIAALTLAILPNDIAQICSAVVVRAFKHYFEFSFFRLAGF